METFEQTNGDFEVKKSKKKGFIVGRNYCSNSYSCTNISVFLGFC